MLVETIIVHPKDVNGTVASYAIRLVVVVFTRIEETRMVTQNLALFCSWSDMTLAYGIYVAI